MQTNRLIIRRFKSTDLAYLIDMFSDEKVMRFIGPRKAMTETETQAWLTNILQSQDTELTRHAVALKENDELIGAAGLKEEDGVKDFGYYFRREYWGRGYAREACSALIGYIEDELHIQDYQIFIADENIRSIKMIERLGFHAGERINKSGEQGHHYMRTIRQLEQTSSKQDRAPAGREAGNPIQNRHVFSNDSCHNNMVVSSREIIPHKDHRRQI